MDKTKIKRATAAVSLMIAAMPAHGGGKDAVQLKIRDEHALILSMRDSAINFVRKEELSQTGDAVIDKYVLGVREHEIEDITSYAAKADRQVDERFKSKRSWTGKDAKKLSMMNNDLEDQIHTVDTYANIAVGMIEQEVKPEQPACKI